MDVSSESEYITLSIKLGKCNNMVLHHIMVYYITLAKKGIFSSNGSLRILSVDRKYAEGFHNRGIGSVWVSNETRPEHFSRKWRSRYAKGEPNHSGACLYLSASRGLKWRDTSCEREKGVLCETNEVLCHGGHPNNPGNAQF